MRIGPARGPYFELEPVRYEYPELVDAGSDDWFDANWLVIRATVRTADGRRWTFSGPCLLTAEARGLAQWLRRAAAGDADPSPSFDEQSPHVAAFTEPNIAFSVAARTHNVLVVRAQLSLEAGPPWRSSEDDEYYEPYVLDLHVTPDEVNAAADAWESDLEAFPVRGSM